VRRQLCQFGRGNGGLIHHIFALLKIQLTPRSWGHRGSYSHRSSDPAQADRHSAELPDIVQFAARGSDSPARRGADATIRHRFAKRAPRSPHGPLSKDCVIWASALPRWWTSAACTRCSSASAARRGRQRSSATGLSHSVASNDGSPHLRRPSGVSSPELPHRRRDGCPRPATIRSK
jgi:hypothetical protein